MAAPYLHKLEEYLEIAEQSDNLVEGKVKEHEEILKVLGSGKSEVEAFVPDSQRVKMTPN